MKTCRICSQPSCVLGSNYKKVPFRPNSDAKSFVCGVCVGTGIYAEERSMRREQRAKDIVVDAVRLEEVLSIRQWTQAKLARLLGVSRQQINKVMRGEKNIPEGWLEIIEAA